MHNEPTPPLTVRSRARREAARAARGLHGAASARQMRRAVRGAFGKLDAAQRSAYAVGTPAWHRAR